MKTIYFRIDFGAVIGFGHLFRCRNIALECQDRGYKVVFLYRSHVGADTSKLSPFEFKCIGKGIQCKPNDASNWLGTTEEEDARESMAVMTEKSLIFVDHFSLGLKWEETISQKHKIITLDDNMREKHIAALLIDYNYFATASRYKTNAKLLLGLGYFPTVKGIEKYKISSKCSTSPEALIHLGACEQVLQANTIQAFLDSKLSKKFSKIHVISTCDFSSNKFELQNSNLKFHTFFENIYQFLAQIDFVVGACGLSFIERMILRMKQVNFSIVDNTNENVLTLKEIAPRSYLGDLRNLKISEITDKFDNLIEINPNEITPTLEILDGRGAYRIVNEIDLLA